MGAHSARTCDRRLKGMTTRPVRLGVQLRPQHSPYDRIRHAAAELDAVGVDVIFNWDHFFPLYGEPNGLHFESWTMLAALAEQTTHAELAALVNCNSYRNPNLQADMARTIDHISAKGGFTGRFIFGTGSGWFERDYVEYGYEFGTVGGRLDALAHDLPIIRSRWDELNPPPTRRIPILIGGAGEKKTLRIVAQHADIWHSFADVPALRHKLGILAEHGDAVGRDVSDIEVSVELRDRTMQQADELHEAGATLFTLGLDGPEFDMSVVREWLEWRDRANG